MLNDQYIRVESLISLNYETFAVIARSESANDEAIPLSSQIAMRLLRPDKNRGSQ